MMIVLVNLEPTVRQQESVVMLVGAYGPPEGARPHDDMGRGKE